MIGQHMRLCVPDGVEPVWVRRVGDALHCGLDLTDPAARADWLEAELPTVIVNLAGESRPDVVERDPSLYWTINSYVPGRLAGWCDDHGAHLIQVSSQAVFSGNEPPYGPASKWNPVNLYGCQKMEAESRVRDLFERWTIVRPTFVLGVRPMPAIGRENPVELMLSDRETRSANDRWFSVSFAEEVARELWALTMTGPLRRVVHVGAGRHTRYSVAVATGLYPDPCCHKDFEGLASRPRDTRFDAIEDPREFEDSIGRCVNTWRSRQEIGIEQRAREISIFTGQRADECLEKLRLGFGPLHNAVTEDFRRVDPRTDEELLEWYRSTEAYIWELSAYHCDPLFNYVGMCQGIAEGLKARGARRVLCLGDGIGDLTLTLARQGFDAAYHDLAGSRTADFALRRLQIYGATFELDLTTAWRPALVSGYDAIVSLDFLEHVTDVPSWVGAIARSLRPGGVFVAQNAFACGSGPDGAMPMHLARNDRFEHEWDPMLAEMGFVQEAAQWYRRAA